MGIVLRRTKQVTTGLAIAAVVCVMGCDRPSSSTIPSASRPSNSTIASASEKATERAQGLKNSDSIQIELIPIAVPGMKLLSLDSSKARPTSIRPVEMTHISHEQCQTIIDYLATDGFLNNATAYDMADPQYKGPTVVMRVHWGKGFYDEDLGWGIKMLNRLGGLRSIMDGDASRAMDKFIAQLSAQRRE